MRTGTGTICSRAPIDRRSWSRTLAAAVVPATLAIAVLPCSAAEPLSFHRQTL